MIIDCHFHLEERALTVDRLISEIQKAGVDRVALMGSIIGPFDEPPVFLIKLLQKLLENSLTRGVGRALVSNFTPKGEVKILGKSYLLETDPDNEKVFATVQEHPDKFLGWIFVNPRGRKNQVREFEKYKDMPGFIGVKAHSFWHHFRPVELTPVAQKLVRTGKPLLIHTGFGEEGDFEALLKNVPDLKLILAHAGFPDYADTWKKIKPLKNVFLDLSQTTYTSERATLKTVEMFGADRLFFGTDGPFGFHGPDHQYDYGFIKRRIENMFADVKIKKKLLGESFANVVDL
ncbi:MAG TPA: amidohydrolase family protein [Smithellaceae bacterium]|nr:amidohydrolase family protein [Smithellaceae bacterium]